MSSVNIIGKGRGWEEAPIDGENWGITQLLLRRPVDLVIDMNVYDDMRWGENEWHENQRVMRICSDQGILYYGLQNYPIDTIIREFRTDYFTNTVDYALALAIYLGHTEIHLYGVSMATGTEYAYQKPGVDFWCGVALGRGARIIVHGEQSTILKSRDGLVYGYGTPQKRENGVWHHG
jgi:hypothetical protein